MTLDDASGDLTRVTLNGRRGRRTRSPSRIARSSPSRAARPSFKVIQNHSKSLASELGVCHRLGGDDLSELSVNYQLPDDDDDSPQGSLKVKIMRLAGGRTGRKALREPRAPRHRAPRARPRHPAPHRALPHGPVTSVERGAGRRIPPADGRVTPQPST